VIGIAVKAITHHLDLKLDIVLRKAAACKREGAFPKAANFLRRNKEKREKDKKEEQACFHQRKLGTNFQLLPKNVLKDINSLLKEGIYLQKAKAMNQCQWKP